MISILEIAAPVTTDSGEQVTSVLGLMTKGGFIMIPILLLSLISVYVFIERFAYIRTAAEIDRDFIKALVGEVKAGKIEGAKKLAEDNPGAVGRIMENGLEKLGKPMEEVESYIETAANLEIKKMERNTGYLGIIAGIAPMLGFIGTIAGVIKIFYNISLADNISIGIIAGGLYQKMICSGTGLIVGVLAYTFYHYLQMRIDKYTIRLQESLLEFFKVL